MSNLPFVEETAGSSSGSGSAPPLWVSGAYYSAGVSAVSPPDVVTSPTDFQRYTRIVSGTGSTDPASDPTNWQPTGDRAIKSIQRGVIAITGATATATITTVVTAKSELRFLGFDSIGTDNTHSLRIVLTNTTTITATQGVGGAAGNVSWELTERY